jgi:hypothetical protein
VAIQRFLSSITYPLTIRNGDLALSTGADVIRDDIISYCQTLKGERKWRGEFGADLLAFGTEEDAALALRLQLELELILPGVVIEVQPVEDVEALADGIIALQITYTYQGASSTLRTGILN